jgi:hypothetical protein
MIGSPRDFDAREPIKVSIVYRRYNLPTKF